ncbi:wall-associated receptor kinase 5-like isoform X2 [Panicum hallii]|uniref:wall-associated receptor kinase 5-like isoform X2 n=1 Tax=Panicum hallii TaxID=206008 RepID=UPI000DF4E9BF|nr:wall-associated receptor kinase 5-like isoform X2 [Panicum hallii]
MNTSKPKSMEVVLMLGLGLLLVAANCTPATAVPSSECRRQCGNVEITYPFGIGMNCSMPGGFDVTCQRDLNGFPKPFIGGRELLDISLTNSTIRVLNPITTYCYNDTTPEQQLINGTSEWLKTDRNSPFRFSEIRNKFTVIGCNTLGVIANNNSGSEYLSGCFSYCGRNLSAQMDSSCSGMGCCQTTIPKGMDFNEVGLGVIKGASNTSRTWKGFGQQCSYAVVTEAAAFSFRTTYITTTGFSDMAAGRAPAVLDWSIRNGTCEVAERNLSGSYACRSANSKCFDSTSGSAGYVCNCSQGYEGNPYLPDGCKDVDECNQGRPCPPDGVCRNTVGGYRCYCPTGRKYSQSNNTCVFDTGLLIVGFLGLMIFSFFGYMILQKRKLKKVKQEYFRQHGGLILFETMKSEKGLAFTVFSEDELRQATNNYDKSRIIGKGGHGTVYKGVLKGKPVAIKRCTLIDERQKKEFGQEMLILSQINHKNIVKLVGCCLEVEVPVLVYEYIPNGTMYELIHGGNQELQTSFSTLLRVAQEAAEGLSFLHSYASPPILHGDVKTANILLDENYMAKVSDFGASILAPSDKEQYVTMVQGTVGYLDPEYMQTCQLTEKSDVYSFGVILLEVLTGEVPLKLYGPEATRSLTSNFLSAMKENSLSTVVASHVTEQESTELIRGLAELAKNCLDMCGSNRPSMKEIAHELSRLRKLSIHPWVQLTMEETETQRLLRGPADTSFETESSGIGYPGPDGANQPINPVSSYYAR